MIISASRRTDIPSYYSDWFMNRIKDGFAYVRNPMNPRHVSKVALSPDVVDGIVFWTKNPLPMLERLYELEDFMYYFQFTLTSYGSDIERNVPSKNDVIIPAFRRLSEMTEPRRVIWRYDPVFISDKYTVEYHMKYFEEIARRLEGYTRRCVFSFGDMYKSISAGMRATGLRPPTVDEMHILAEGFSETARQHEMELMSCAEEIDLDKYGIRHGSCIDRALFEQLLGRQIRAANDKNQRGACGCAASVDIGMYSTCRNGCVYCYANHSNALLEKRCADHDPTSPFISGNILDGDEIKTRIL